MRATLVVLAALSLAACESITGCKEDRNVVELTYGSTFYEFQLDILNSYRTRGYDCKDDGAIRNAFGREIGARYVCSKCD